MAYVNEKKVLFSPVITGTGGSTGLAITNVAELPTTDISATAFYRTPKGLFHYDGVKWNEVSNLTTEQLNNITQSVKDNSTYVKQLKEQTIPQLNSGIRTVNQKVDEINEVDLPNIEKRTDSIESCFASTTGEYRVTDRPYSGANLGGGYLSGGVYGIATTIVPTLDDLQFYSIGVDLVDNSTEVSSTTKKTFSLADMARTEISGGYSLEAACSPSPAAYVWIIYDYDAFNNAYFNFAGAIILLSNGVYLNQDLADAQRPDGSMGYYLTSTHTLYQNVQKLKNEHLDLPENKDFKNLLSDVETLKQGDDRKLDKSSKMNVVYANDSTGKPSVIPVNSTPSESNLQSIVQRNVSGGITVEKEHINYDTDAVNKKYVDDSTSGKLDKRTVAKNSMAVYIAQAGGAGVTFQNMAHLAVSAESNAVPRRDFYGNVLSPSIEVIEQGGDRAYVSLEYARKLNNELSSKVTDVEAIAKGATQAVSFDNYEEVVASLAQLGGGEYRVGQHLLVRTINVPDLWVSAVESPVEYAYTSDDAIVSALKSEGKIQVGCYVLSALETQKVDLSNYAKKDEIPTVPTNVSEFSNDAGYVDEEKLNEALGNIPSEAIIDVDTLPTENINENAFYRVKEAHEAHDYYAMTNGRKGIVTDIPATVIGVETLPEVGTPLANSTFSLLTFYLRTSDSTIHCYIDETTSQALQGVPVGWQPGELLGQPYEVVSSPEHATEADLTYFVHTVELLYDYIIYAYTNGEWEKTGQAIVDCDKLPAVCTNTNVFYRIELSGYYTIMNGVKDVFEGFPSKVIPVTALPEVGEPFVDNFDAPTQFTLYLHTSEPEVYLYYPAELTGGTAMWVSATQAEMAWALVSSSDEATESNVLYIVGGSEGQEQIYAYLSGKWIEVRTGASGSSVKVPTKVSELENDAGYVTNEQLNGKQDTVAFDGTYDVSNNKAATVQTVVDKLSPLSESGSEGLRYYLYDTYAYSMGRGECVDEDIVIPDEVLGLPVTRIVTTMFANDATLKSLVIGKNVTIIGTRAFENCANLESVTIPKSVTTIESSAFTSKSLLNVYYEGTEEEWAAIEIGSSNYGLNNATKYYNSEV